MSLRARPIAAAFLAAACTVAAVPLRADAGPALLVDAGSGRVLYADGQDNEWFPASLTKIMTAYLTFDALRSGRLKLTDTVVVSELAHTQVPSKIGLPVGHEITVDIAIRALVIKSANDVAIMLAEKIGGSQDAFVRLMNDTAKRLGMTRTHFVNANGLPVAGQMSTARDLATLSLAVLREFPEHNALWGMPEFRFGKLHLRSHNGLLRSFEGADGLKTGFICDSGFNIVASATRDGTRLIAVVLGEPSGKDRTLRAASLLEHGFETATWKTALGAPTLDKLPIDPVARPLQSVRSSVKAWACHPHTSARKATRRKARGTAAKKRPHTRHGAPSKAQGGRKSVTIMVPAAKSAKGTP
jgi:D-alanyl-D-alanine carboxypeptidase